MAFRVGHLQSSFGRIPVSERHASRPGTRRPRILLYGDSNTAGFCSGGAHFEPYGKSLSHELAKAGAPCDIVLCGGNGLTTLEMLENVHNPMMKDVVGCVGKGLERIFMEEGQQDLAIIMSGTNDIGKGTNAEGCLQRLQQMHDVCHKRGVPTIALAPPTIMAPGAPRMERDRLAVLLKSWASSSPLVVEGMDVEMLVPRLATSGLWEYDQLHMSPAGSKELGRRLTPAVLSFLASGQKVAKPPLSLGGGLAGAAALQVEVESPTRMHRPISGGGKTPAGTRPVVGQAMEYYSATHGGWVPCVIIEVEPNGNVRLDVKPAQALTPEEQLRKLRPSMALPDGSPQASPSHLQAARMQAVQPAAAQQLQAVTDGSPSRRRLQHAATRDLRHERGRGNPAEAMQRAAHDAAAAATSSSPQLRLQVGQQVEYHSKSNGGWVLATIIAVDSGGSVELDVKPGCKVPPKDQAAKLRPRRELDRSFADEVPQHSAGSMHRSASL
mmetsp:Transcript_46854/g.111501  ORF Transcript_46854/g.111501 Transcript_46854/m.111501 type:complete len:497 (-) Transcript_46854:70-1560(-)|eukprot:CAMPEP_0178385368 /NCGR_PEP_ID=MMETSP0689_2-20121128/7997_1 /TAXON_ID=160604 /ORGANISM="Amphidinium massartii, Strain CS-259" /LENGTH=496 /DNA_ID=CAMNT_0020005649 /DNA_START=241 /DNA_END=1731 /DNA_ORIENTATION=+